MRRPGRRYAQRRFTGLSAALVIAFSLGLSLLWPRAAVTSAARTPSRLRVSFAGSVPADAPSCREALLFVSAPPRATQVPGEAVMDTPRVAATAVPAPPLERPSAPAPDGAATAPSAQRVALAREGSAYRGLWPQARVFRGPPAGSLSLSVATEGDLRRFGFEAAALPPDLARRSGLPWLARLYVQCGADGRTEDVFVEKGSGDPKLDAGVVRAVAAGRLRQAGTACGGRVTLNYGSE
jgi:hypothetical protein